MVRDNRYPESPAVKGPPPSDRAESRSAKVHSKTHQPQPQTDDHADKSKPSVHPSLGLSGRARKNGSLPSSSSTSSATQPMQQKEKAQQSRLSDIETLPLTVAQRGIWIGEKVSRVGTVFNIAEAVEIHGEVDPDLFIEALHKITAEVEITRVNIYEDADGPKQIIHTEYKGDLPFVDCTNEAEPEQFARDWMMSDVTAPLNIERDPLWKSALLKIAPDHFIWHHRAHHIVSDGYTGGIIAPRLAEIYDAALAGNAPSPAPFPPLRVINEQEKIYRASKRFMKDRDYWVDRLTDLPDPVSFAQGRWPTENGLARETVYFSPARTEQLRAQAKALSCTMPQFLIALTAAFIHRSTGAPDLVLGMPVAARSRATKNVPGLAANAIMLRLAIGPDSNLQSLTQEATREIRRALRRQLYRFEDMRRDVGMTGQHQRIARIAINVEPFNYNLTFGGHKTTAHNLANSSVEDMVIFIYDRDDGNGLRVDLDANPSLYSKEELKTHRQRFEHVVHSLLDNPELSIGDVEILTKEEKHRQFIEWNDTEHSVPDQAVFQTIETHAQLTPDAIAVRFGDVSVTYSELNARANYMARNLIEHGVGKGDIVALALSRSELYPIAVLAVNKTGAAFLPIDPSDPMARLSHILEDSDAHSVIVRGEDAIHLGQSGRQILEIEEISAGSDPQSVTDKERRSTLTRNDPAYLIYTSGSTGNPKGVVLGHAGLTNMIADAVANFPLTADDRLMAVAAQTFDASILDLYSPLAAGATLVIAPVGIGREPRKLVQLMRREQITAMLVTPPLWEGLVAVGAGELRGLKAGVAGEALTRQLARTMTGLGARVINWYGPTEATVQCTGMPIQGSDCEAPPIGKPIWNMRAYILDENLKSLPVGIAGELCIAGPGVALGYLNKPKLTAERFPQDPYGKSGERLYRTGDLARWRSDGVIEFLGRRDQQLKVHGYRIEPGEIGSVLLEHPKISTAYVTTFENPKGGKRLIAYAASKTDAMLDKNQVVDFLSQRLPAYLIPSTVYILDAMPLTRNGKIDCEALPNPSDENLTPYVAPRTKTEQKLADIFSSMLGIEKISIEDNFFELGADSLTAVQLLLEIEAQFSTQLSLPSLFDAPTIANLAQQMDNLSMSDPFSIVFRFREQGSEAPLFCIHSAVGISWSYAGLLRHLSDRHGVYGLQARGLSNAETNALPASVDAMAEEYLKEIQAIQPKGPYRLLGWSLGGLVAHSITAKLEARGETVDFLALLDAFPSRHGSDAKIHDEAFLSNAALQFMNYVPENLSEPPSDMYSLVQFMFKEFDVFSMPILEQSGLGGDAAKKRFENVIANNFKIALNHQPSKVNANILLARALEGKNSNLDSLVDHQKGTWQTYTTGQVVEHVIPCHHFEILNPEPLALLGPIIREAISRS